MKQYRLILVALLLHLGGYAQYYSTGQDPASLHWKSLKTDRFKIIYPAPFEQKAQYLANIMEVVCTYDTGSLSARVPRIPVILHTQTVVSNGVTVWAPKRIELYTCPPQQSYAEEWLEQLAIHEYRHAVQISKINQGFTKALYYFFGEQITGGILGLYIPAWFLEGDATVAETSLSNAGRGRSGLFESTLRAQILEKGPYHYDLATLGSYKTFTPDAYSLGYFLVGQSRIVYGDRLWNEALNRVAKYPFMVVPFNSGIHKVTGKWKVQLYKETLQSLDSLWLKQMNNADHPPGRTITKRNPKIYTVYTHPNVLNDSTILADKSSMDDVDRFVIINRKTGDEHVLLTPGFHNSGTTSVGGDYLAWSEQVPDARWSNRNYSDLLLYNFKTGKKSRLTRRSRYFSPILYHDGSKLAAVSVTENSGCAIDILAIPSGMILQTFKLTGNRQAVTPNWSPDGTKIIFTMTSEKGQTIATLDLSTGKFKTLIPWSFNEFNGPAFFYRHYIIFSVDHSGVENIYARDTIHHTIFKITAGRFAMYDPDFTSDKKDIICSDYTSDGLMVVDFTIDSTTWVPLHQINNYCYPLGDKLSFQEHLNIQDTLLRRKIYKLNQEGPVDHQRDSVDGKIFTARKYRKFLNLFNPHSWAPASFDVNNLTFNPGIMVLSQNSLSTMFAGAGWEYDLNEQTGRFYTSLSYRGWYPVLNFRFDIGNRAGYLHQQGSEEVQRFTWQETNFKTSLSIPWNFSRGRYNRSLQPSIGATLIGIKHNTSTPVNFTNGWILTLDYRLAATQYQQSTPKDLYPKFGQSVDIVYRHTPLVTNDLGSVFGAESNLFFPGIFRHHGLWLYGGYQQRNEKDLHGYSFSNIIHYPRGYQDAYDDELLSLSCTYKLPLWYPDFSFGSVIYLKRLKLSLYYDWAQGNNPGYINSYQSAGGELTADFHILRFVAPAEIGIRSVYYPLSRGWGFEFLYAISY